MFLGLSLSAWFVMAVGLLVFVLQAPFWLALFPL